MNSSPVPRPGPPAHAKPARVEPSAPTWSSIDSVGAAAGLVAHLLDPERALPGALVTIQAGRPAPLVDFDRIVADLQGYAEVYLMPTGAVSRAYADALRAYPGTECYGGACRVYPPGLEWLTALHRSPLRFVYTSDDADRVTGLIVSDALEMAVRSGSVSTAPPAATSHPAAGQVLGLTAGRVLVRLDDGRPATIVPELTAAGVAAENLLPAGMRVDGRFDPTNGRLDVTGMLISPGDALTGYPTGSQLPGRVVAVETDLCILEVFPDFRCTVPATAVLDTRLPVDLRQWLTEGETVAARILVRGDTDDDWQLSLLDLDPGTPLRPAPAVLTGGPPWLPAPSTSYPDTAATAQTDTDPDPTDDDQDAGAADERRVPATPRPKPRPTPGNTAGDLAQPPHETAPTATPTVTAEDPTLAQQLQDLTGERDALASQLHRAQQILDARDQEVQALKARGRDSQAALTKAGRATAGLDVVIRDHDADRRAFIDPEQQFRYEVDLAYARRIPAAEKPDLPLRPYILGADFLPSLETTGGVDRDKVVDVTVDIATGRIHHLAGRHTHQLRTSDTPGAPYRTRPDGATCWRVYLQHKTPQARRLHYWQHGDGTIELSSVRLHDDPRP